MPPSPYNRDELEELLRLARQGEGEALGRLLQEYRPYLLRIAHDELPAALQTKAGSSDVVQDTVIEALACFARFRGQTPAELQAWLRTIVLRQVASTSRRFVVAEKRDVAREVPLPATEGGSVNLPDGASSPSQKAGREEQATAVRLALDRLPEHYRQVLVWREWDELPFAEIAQRLGKTADAARMLWWRAIERLNEELNNPT
jgi:RNA polymerase sigma-70 factor (ECF subfamily)